MVEIECSFCRRKTFKFLKKIKYKIKCGQTKFFCSKLCADNDKKSKLIIKVCPFCKKNFESTTHCESPKCCSKKCSGRYSQSFLDISKVSKKTKEAWKRGCYENSFEKLKKYKICPICCKRFYGNKIYCSLICLKNSNINEKISNTRKEMFKNGQLNVTGGTTKWISYKNIRVQGSYEFRVCKILDRLKELGKIKNWNYAKDRFQYIGVDNKKHNYLIDFKVINNDNTFYYLETKGYEKPNDKLKWNAVKNLGFNLLVWFNKDILKEEGLVAPM